MDANKALDYLISAMQDLLDGKHVDIEKVKQVCRDEEMREEIKAALKEE